MDQPLDPTHALIARHGQFLRGLARALVHDEAAALDLEQDTWRAAIEHKEPLRNPRAWLAETAKRIAWSRNRRDARRAERERRAARPESTQESAPGESALDAGDLLQSALRSLDEPFKGTILARYVQGLDPREIAARDGVPLATVKSRLKRGLQRLRTELDARHGGDRRAWSAMLVTGLGLRDLGPGIAGAASMTPDPGAPATSLAAPARITSGGPLKAAIAMKLPLIAAGLVAITALTWGLLSGTDATAEPPTASWSGMVTTDSDTQLAEIAPLETRSEREVVMRGVEGADVLAPSMPFTLDLVVDVTDEDGQPSPGVRIELGPSGHPLNFGGFTDSSGHFEFHWGSRLASMDMDVAAAIGSYDLVGIQRIDVTSGAERRLVIQAPRSRGSQFAAKRVRLLNDLPVSAVTASSRGHVVHPESIPQENGQHAFRWRAFEEIDNLIVVGVEDFLVDDQPKVAPGVIEGTLTNTAGQPIPDYALRFQSTPLSTKGGPTAMGSVRTYRNGQFRLECAPGTLRCDVGPADDSVRFETKLTSGTTVLWNPVVSQERDAIIQLGAGGGGVDVDSIIFQARADNGSTRWVGRAHSSESGRATILGCPDTLIHVDMIAPEKIAPLPLVTIDDVPTGRVWNCPLPEDQAIQVMALHMSIEGGDKIQDARELLVFDAAQTAGVRVALAPGTDQYQVMLPGGALWAELFCENGGTAVIGKIMATSDQTADLGAVTPAPTGRFLVPAHDRKDRLEIHRLLDGIDSLVYDSTDPMDGLPADRVLELPPGMYRLRATEPSGEARTAELSLAPSETQSPDLP